MNNKMQSIQALRGIAALSVMLLHFQEGILTNGAAEKNINFFGWGGIGVDLFFVISGFIMVYITHNKGYGFPASVNFITSRLIRVLPTYYIILLFAFFTNGAMSIFHYPEKVTNLISALTFQPYIIDRPPMYVGADLYSIRWTLNYEVYFYLAFAACLLFAKKMRLLILWLAVPSVISFMILGEITLSTEGYHYNNIYARFVTNPIILEFGMGALAGVAWLKLRNSIRMQSAYLTLLLLALIVAGIATKILTSYSLISGLSFSLLVLLFALQNESLLKMIPRPLIKIGNISFSLYLLHLPLAYIVSHRLEKIAPDYSHGWMAFILTISVSIVVAALSHKYIEIKLTNKIKNTLSNTVFFSTPAREERS